MSSVPPDDSASLQRTWLVFALGPYVMCASALDVEGIIQCPEAIAKLPLTPDYALGAFLFRGRPAAAISLRRKLRLAQGEDLRTGPFIVTRIGSALVAFWVDEVKDVIEEKDAAWRPMPAMLDGALFRRFAIRENQLILQTSFAALREAKVEFDPLAAWVAAQGNRGLTDTGEAAPTAPSVVAAPQPVAPDPEIKDHPSERKNSSAAADAAAMSPAQSPVTSKLRLPAPPASKPRRVPPRTGSASAPGAIASAPVAVHIQVDPVSAPEPPSIDSSAATRHAVAAPASARAGFVTRRLIVALGLAIGAISALISLLQPSTLDERRARPLAPAAPASAQGSIAVAAVPVMEPATQRATSLEPDGVTLTIERRRAETSDAKVKGTGVARRSSIIHTVVAGDTLWHIAKKQVGDPFRYPELAKLSDIRDPNLIRPGDVIRIEIPKQP